MDPPRPRPALTGMKGNSAPGGVPPRPPPPLTGLSGGFLPGGPGRAPDLSGHQGCTAEQNDALLERLEKESDEATEEEEASRSAKVHAPPGPASDPVSEEPEFQKALKALRDLYDQRQQLVKYDEALRPVQAQFDRLKADFPHELCELTDPMTQLMEKRQVAFLRLQELKAELAALFDAWGGRGGCLI